MHCLCGSERFLNWVNLWIYFLKFDLHFGHIRKLIKNWWKHTEIAYFVRLRPKYFVKRKRKSQNLNFTYYFDMLGAWKSATEKLSKAPVKCQSYYSSLSPRHLLLSRHHLGRERWQPPCVYPPSRLSVLQFARRLILQQTRRSILLLTRLCLAVLT